MPSWIRPRSRRHMQWLDALPLTRAAFEEAMRLYPPAPSINREPIEDDQYQDLKLPKGSAVLVMPWTVHRHRLYWDNPEAFMPSRFHPENRDKIDRFQYLPFGAGPRVCIGASFACRRRSLLWQRCSIATVRYGGSDQTLAGAKAHHPAGWRPANDRDGAAVERQEG